MVFVNEVKHGRDKLTESHVVGTTAAYEIVHDSYASAGDS